MFETREKRELLTQYSNMCEAFNKAYRRMQECAEKGDREAVEKQKEELRQINKIIIGLQKRLDSFPYIPNYKRDEGYNINLVTEKLDEFAESFIEHAHGMEREDGTMEYKNDGFVDERRVPKEDARRAAEAWGEGYEPLIDFLETCIEHDIQTFACCSGHEEGDISYVLLDASDDKALELAQFIIENQLTDEIVLLKNDDTGKVFLNINTSMDNRERFYNACIEHIKEDRKREKEDNEQSKASLLGKIAMMMEQEELGYQTEYFIKDDSFRLVLEDDSIVQYSTTDLTKKIQEDPSGRSIKPKKSVIDRVKDMCRGFNIGIHDIMASRDILGKGQRETTRDNENERVEE